MQSTDRDHFFETESVHPPLLYIETVRLIDYSASAAQRERKAAKAGNKNGNPLVMKSKILAAIPDPAHPYSSIFIAESAGFVRRVNLEVCHLC